GRPSSTDRRASLPEDHRPRSPVPHEGFEAQKGSDKSLLDRGVRRSFHRARAGPLSTRGSPFRTAGASVKRPDLCSRVCPPWAKEAASSTTAELAELTSEVLRGRSVDR